MIIWCNISSEVQTVSERNKEKTLEDIEFTVNRDEAGVTGFTLMGVGKTEAETFCLSFLTAQTKGKGDVVFEDGKIVFKHGGVSMQEANPAFEIYGMCAGGVHSAEIATEDAEALSQLLSRSGKYVGVQIRARPELAWGKGFTIYVKRD